MHAKITGEDDVRVGLHVTDNNNAKHRIEMEFNGSIEFHDCDEYADKASQRTTAENEHSNQARRFARFYVYRERGYDTLEPMRNPDRIAIAVLAVASLEGETFHEVFGWTLQQLWSRSSDVEPIVVVPQSADDELHRVGQDIYLREGETLATELEALTETEAYDRLETAVGAKPGDTSLSTVQETLAELDLDLSETAHSLGDALLEAVGPVSVRWEHSQDDHRVVSADQTGPLPAREPDIRPEMIAEFYPIESVDEFQEAFVHHLRCQVRDCYLEMGIAPPRPFRTLGPGFYENIGWYAHHEFYPDYHDYQAEITDWGEEHTPVDLY